MHEHIYPSFGSRKYNRIKYDPNVNLVKFDAELDEDPSREQETQSGRAVWGTPVAKTFPAVHIEQMNYTTFVRTPNCILLITATYSSSRYRIYYVTKFIIDSSGNVSLGHIGIRLIPTGESYYNRDIFWCFYHAQYNRVYIVTINNTTSEHNFICINPFDLSFTRINVASLGSNTDRICWLPDLQIGVIMNENGITVRGWFKFINPTTIQVNLNDYILSSIILPTDMQASVRILCALDSGRFYAQMTGASQFLHRYSGIYTIKNVESMDAYLLTFKHSFLGPYVPSRFIFNVPIIDNKEMFAVTGTRASHSIVSSGLVSDDYVDWEPAFTVPGTFVSEPQPVLTPSGNGLFFLTSKTTGVYVPRIG